MNTATRLIGTWRLLSLDNTDGLAGPEAAAGGKSSADGLIMYGADGYMSAQIISPEGAAPFRPSAYHAYFGTYTVDSTAATIVHHRIANNNPDAPKDVVRQFRFLSDDVLILFPEGHSAVQLTFQRAGQAPP